MSAGERGRVLLVGAAGEPRLDDALCEFGYDVVRRSGLDGLEDAIRGNRPDITIIDLGGDSAEAVASVVRLREDAAMRQAPLLLLEPGEPSSLDLGLTECIRRPASVDYLLARVRATVEVKRLLDHGERRSERLAALLEISRALNSTLDSGAILYMIARKISEAMELGRCSFIVPDLQNGIGRVIACKDDPNIQSLVINLANYPEIIQVLRYGNRVIIADVEKDPIMEGVRKFADVFRDQSIMTLPLKFQSEVIGVLQIRKKSQKRGFTVREVEYCELLANAAASALKNAQLYEDIEKHNEELRDQKRELEDLSQELRRKNQELIELHQQREDLTAMIVHDMRSPLMVVQGVFDLLQYKSRGKPDERELIDDGIGVTKKMLRLIGNLLEVAKLEAGEVRLHCEEVDVGSLVVEAVEAFQILAQKQGLDLRSEVAPDLPRIRADRGCLSQVLDNLLSNACKFAPHGSVRVSVHGRDGGGVEIVVEDNGEGIAAADLGSIFKKFRQGRTGERRGTGLGLTIVELLVNAHGGTVSVNSEVGKGSRFVVRLPRDADTQAAGGRGMRA